MSKKGWINPTQRKHKKKVRYVLERYPYLKSQIKEIHSEIVFLKKDDGIYQKYKSKTDTVTNTALEVSKEIRFSHELICRIDGKARVP